jgi:CheY-like chemotaxis protein/tetratricopeptide (TPR) repeat protein
MHLATEILHELDNPALSVNQRAGLQCRLARHLERAGDYEAASEAMANLWQGVGARPMVEGLDDETRAQVLLRVGALTGWIGSASQIEGSQEMAKDLISESARAFEALGKRNEVGEARSDLALCYWREGAYDEARVTLQEALSEFDERHIEQRAIALLRRAEVERSSTRLNEALRVFNQAAPLFDEVNDHYLTATFHFGFANTLNGLSSAEHRKDYVDRALIEYTAASFHFEQAGHERYQACVENNLGFLFSTLGRFEDAHEHLDRAQVLMTRLKDNVHLAQVDETRARVLLAEGRTVEAEKTARAAVLRLEKGDELSLLAEALTTHGISQARLNHFDQAREALKQAINVAEQAGDSERAGVAGLTLVEQLGTNLSYEEVWTAIDRTGALLEKTQELSTLRRLLKCACRAFFLTDATPAPPDWANFSLRQAVHRYEAHWIKLALKEVDGQVTRAAPLLGFKHHQSLSHVINTRHKDLLETRSPVRKRRSHLIAHPKRKTNKPVPNIQKRGTAQISILHVEDNQAVANIVRETLELEGWKIETCGNGNLALEKIASEAPYDLILLDNELPGLNGMELIQRARSIAHRQHTSIVMLSATVDNAAAQQAGADLGLHKPEEITTLANTISRLLNLQSAEDNPRSV